LGDVVKSEHTQHMKLFVLSPIHNNDNRNHRFFAKQNKTKPVRKPEQQLQTAAARTRLHQPV
jgi:hypothetical protein